MRRLAAVLLAAAALAAVLVAGRGGGGDGDERAAVPPPPEAVTTSDLAPPPEAAFEIGKPVPLASSRHETRWAPVRRPAAVRARPDAAAPELTRLETRTPEDTENLVVALARTEADGQLWVRVSVASLPNGLRGWVPRSALGGYTTVTTHLRVDRDALTATLTRDGREVFAAPVGIGTADAPTPPGSFYVRNRLEDYGSPFYGPLAFGTSARSETLTDWPDGGFVGIHGTSLPDLLPGRVSHGCIRLRNPDILRLAKLMPIGTPVTIT